MSQLLITAALVAATAVAADHAFPNPGLPMPGSLPGFANAGGITEQGRGVVSIAADRLKITLRAFNTGPMPAGATSFAATYQEIVATMRANGIADAHVVTPLLGGLQNNEQIAGTIAKPTYDTVAAVEGRILAAVPQALLAANRNVNVGGLLEVDDCAGSLERARENAYADARKRAESLAKTAGIRIGTLLAASETDTTAGCPGSYPVGPYFAGSNDSSLKWTVDVTVYVNATFRIRP